jgi:hypothetical protein
MTGTPAILRSSDAVAAATNGHVPGPRRIATGIDLVFTCGPNMHPLHEKLPTDCLGAHADVALLKGPDTASLARSLERMVAAPAPTVATAEAR